jgi:AP-1 complex subunit mu
LKARPPPELTKNTGRPAGIVYQKNEAFLDVVEKVNLLVNQNGTLLKSEIEGQIRIKAFLSGMPEVRLGLNDRVQFGKGLCVFFFGLLFWLLMESPK